MKKEESTLLVVLGYRRHYSAFCRHTSWHLWLGTCTGAAESKLVLDFGGKEIGKPKAKRYIFVN